MRDFYVEVGFGEYDAAWARLTESVQVTLGGVGNSRRLGAIGAQRPSAPRRSRVPRTVGPLDPRIRRCPSSAA